MRNLKRTGFKPFLAWIFVLVVICISVFSSNVCAASTDDDSSAQEAKQAKKIISVVYDDSGSMCRSTSTNYNLVKWAQANYAMQAFASLLSEQDEMYITYMSSAKADSQTGEYKLSESDIVTVDTGNAQGSVDKIRGKIEMGSTPIQSVDLAYNKLQSISDGDETTQYWLVILTDGEMFEGDNQKTSSNLQAKLDGLAGTTMPNGSNLYITYLGIAGDNDAASLMINGDSSKGFDATVQKDVVDSLSNIANKVSGRMLFDEKAITKVDDHTVKVSSKIPMYSISVFSQRSNAKVKSVDSAKDIRNVSIKYPEKSGWKTDESLFGNTALITNGNGKVLPAGEYTITFDSEISDKAVFMFQPAIVMVPSITKDGTKINVKKIGKKVHEGDEINIELIPTNPETGDRIEDEDLPEGIEWSISYKIEGSETAHSSSRELNDVKVGYGENKIICQMKIKGMTPQRDIYTFNIEKPVIYEFKAGSTGGAIYKRAKMGKNGGTGDPITFTLTADGEPLSKAQMKEMDVIIEEVTLDDSKVTGNWFETSGWRLASTDYDDMDDGGFIIYPKPAGLTPFLIKPGEYRVKVKVILPNGSEQTIEGTFTVVGHWTDWLFLIIILAILLFVFYSILVARKPKFHGETVAVNVYETDGGKKGIKQIGMCKSQTLRSFNSIFDFTPSASTYSFGNIKVTASKYGGIVIKKAVIKKFVKFGSGYGNPEKAFLKVVNSLDKCSGGKKGEGVNIPDEQPLGTDPFFLYSSAGLLYEIFIK